MNLEITLLLTNLINYSFGTITVFSLGRGGGDGGGGGGGGVSSVGRARDF